MPTDGGLLARYTRTGDQAAFAELVERHGPMVLASCRRLAGEAEAEDVAQAVWLLLARKAAGLSGERDLAPWLHRASGFVARTALRERARRAAREKEAAAMRPTTPSAAGTEVAAATRAELLRQIDAAIESLARPYRQVAVLCCLEGLTQEATARRLGLPLGTVAAQRMRAMEKLRERLSRQGVVLGAAALGIVLAESTASAAAGFSAAKFLPSAAAAGGKSALLAKGAAKTILWAKVKVATAALAVVAAAGGVGAPLVLRAAAGSPPESAPPDERAAVAVWAGEVFSGKSADEPPPPWLWVRRQDHGPFNRNKSTMNTPIQIGDKRFARGLGTHSVSEIVIRLDGPAKEFTAQAGIDNNHDTKGQHGSAVFAVEADGRELFRSGLCRGGGAPVPVKVELNGARRVVLRVTDGGDGPGWDQADWAEAAITMADGKQVFLDEVPGMSAELGLVRQTPFSFTYGGKASADLLPGWKREENREPATAAGRELRVITCTDPATGLEVRCEVTTFKDFPAVDWVLKFTNTGKADSPVLEAVMPLDLGIGVPVGDVVLHRAQGSTCKETDFLPVDEKLATNATVNLAPNGGRSSEGVLPFFNMEWAGGGLAWAVGWSGQWSQQIRRTAPGRLEVRAGQQTFRAKLHPGESIRTPRILLVSWQGADRMRGHNLLRRLLLAHYVPRENGAPALPPATANTWFAFQEGNNVTEANQLESMAAMLPLGVEAFWMDAGWFEGGWPSGVGSWVPKKPAFPKGLKPLGNAVHKAGLKFVLWFEPERVNPGSRIAREHPEFVLGWKNGKSGDGLFNLGDPAARAWLTELLSGTIREAGVDVFRNDFNIAPLPFWQKADEPDRQGIAENRYVEGLYLLWDELKKRHPGLLIDNCASGGRRIDLETCSRSYPLWRSDTQCGAVVNSQTGVQWNLQRNCLWDQAQSAGLSLYVPLHAAGIWGFDRYTARSVATTGASICPDVRGKDFPREAARAAIEEMKALRPLYQGDYYPLAPINVSDDVWCAWQFDRPELGRGFAVFFRRPKATQAGFDAALRGLDPRADYEVIFVDSAKVQKLTGDELARLTVEIPAAPGSVLVTYRKLDK